MAALMAPVCVRPWRWQCSVSMASVCSSSRIEIVRMAGLRAACITVDNTPGRGSRGTAAKAAERCVALGPLEAAELRVAHAPGACERCAAQHLVAAERVLRALARRVGAEAGIRAESGRGPLPDLAPAKAA